ncbi:MAG: nicotinamide mononucleotide transporter [Clostridia bacterium]|nr:nicotinamide mononucleotide transporter [Clostridia bacterium]
MKAFTKLKNYFTKFELLLWLCSVLFIVLSFLIFRGSNVLTLIASIIGITAILICSKGNPIGQGLMIIFSCIYGIISYGYAYYGEMITYLGMSAPMALASLIAWLKNPYNGSKTEVKINTISKKEMVFAIMLTALVTFAFYFILRVLGTSNLTISTISVTTSFLAVYLTFRRSPYFSLLYAFNDIVLMIMWALASIDNYSYISVVVCFAAFLANDLYCFINWLKIRKRQQTNSEKPVEEN